MLEEKKEEVVEPAVNFEIQKRRLLVVWVYSLKQLKNLKRFGEVQYVSRRMKYVLIYMNEEDIDEAEEKIERLHFVRRVERSYRPDIEMNFADKIGTKAAYQVVDDGFEPEELNTEIKLAEELA
ncbi:MAG: YlbG family protein [Lactobacillales bacterium]|jgi:uncharacterized protein YlbG (UPF0298 family)|nr:YlbG family protein [Lactobacillales bacterium]